MGIWKFVPASYNDVSMKIAPEGIRIPPDHPLLAQCGGSKGFGFRILDRSWESVSMVMKKNTVRLWNTPFAQFTFQETLDCVEELIKIGDPCYFVTSNLHTVMLANQNPRMMEAIENSAFNLADGMPMVWASRRSKLRIPERVAGSDVFPALCGIAAKKNYRIFLLGGAPGIGEQAAKNLTALNPGLRVVGIESPMLSSMTPEDEKELFARIRAQKPDMLFVAFGQPKGELWLYQHCKEIGVPVSAQIGATLDFFAGKVPRAPLFLQNCGLEWAYRLYQEPKRLFMRYFNNSLFLFRMLVLGPKISEC